MGQAIQYMIDNIRNDNDLDAARKAFLIAALRKIDSELPADATEDEELEAISRALLSGGDSDDDSDSRPSRSSGSSSEEVRISSADKEYMKRTCAVVEESFNDDDWKYSSDTLRPDYVRYTLKFNIKGRRYQVKVYVEADPRVVRIDVVFPFTVDRLYAYVVCERMAKKNYPLRFGCFEYDERDGELSYSYSFPTEDGLDKRVFDRVLVACMSTAEDEYDYFRRLSVGKLKRKEASETIDMLRATLEDLEDE